MKHTLTVLALLAILTLLTPNSARAGDDKIDLRFHFEEGQTLKLKTKMEQDIVVWIGGNEQETHQTMVIGRTLDVKDVDEAGTATIEVTFGPAAMKVKGRQGTFEYDSEDPPDEVPPPAMSLAAIVDEGFTVKMTPEGRVTEITGVDKMLERLCEAIEALDEETKKEIVESMKRQFGDDAMKQMMESITAILPDEPVAVGDSWSQEIALTVPFSAVFEITGTLTDRTGGVSTVELDCTIKPNPDAPPVKMGSMSMTYKLEGTQKGTLKIDEATGWFAEGQITQEIEGEMIMTSAGEPDEVSVPMLIKSVITIESE